MIFFCRFLQQTSSRHVISCYLHVSTESILPCAKIGNSVEDIKSFMMENPLELNINVTTYDASLQYECPLAQEFLVNSNNGKTEAKLNKTCSWDETWIPDDLVPPCVCKL